MITSYEHMTSSLMMDYDSTTMMFLVTFEN